MSSTVMSIDEYRNLELSPEQEWNTTYNPKKLSIEALTSIEIKKRGRGPDKKVYTNCEDTSEGPYVDNMCLHVHNWKCHKSIPNLTGPQDPSVDHVQKTTFTPGIYCSICHKRNLNSTFKWKDLEIHVDRPTQNIYINTVFYKKEDFIENPIMFPNIKPKEEKFAENDKSRINWNRIINRLIHTMKNDKIVYKISKYKSLLLWPWEMTPYQKFKYNNPNYHDKIFVKPNVDTFRDNFVYIN
tara:strand:+ start:1360 stop:2082 length:723 start_codon:yes stop_codon:yes gene_type:complete